jgi:hypothetical protein
MASVTTTRMSATEHRKIAKEVRDAAEKALKKKIDGQVEMILAQIEPLKEFAAEEGNTRFEHFVQNGTMHDDTPVDPDLKMYGKAICAVVAALEADGYFCKVEEGKFKAISAYGTYITVSTEPFSDDYDYDY